jgi:hypothetical protein
MNRHAKQVLLRVFSEPVYDAAKLWWSYCVVRWMNRKNKPKREPLLGHYFEFWKRQKRQRTELYKD